MAHIFLLFSLTLLSDLPSPPRLPGLSIPGFASLRPTVLYMQYRNSTCCPSATPFALALGPTYPGRSALPGNLDIRPEGFPPSRYSFRHSLFFHSSFRYCFFQMLLYQFLFLASVCFQPRTFSAQDLSTSELLRTL